MIIRLLILGILKRRDSAHGYRMYRDLVEWRVETWTVIRPGSIYHALTQMEKQGYITEVVTDPSQKRGPSKSEYSITASGKEEFTTLLRTALKSIDIVSLSVGIAFMEYLPRHEVVELLQQRANAEREVTTLLGTLPTEAKPSTPAKHPELLRIWSDSFTNAATSTEKLIHTIQSGKYIFKNEEAKK